MRPLFAFHALACALLGAMLGLSACAANAPKSAPAIAPKSAPTKAVEAAPARQAASIVLTPTEIERFRARGHIWDQSFPIFVVSVGENYDKLIFERSKFDIVTPLEMSFSGEILLDQRIDDPIRLNGGFAMKELWVSYCNTAMDTGVVALYEDTSGQGKFAGTTPVKTWTFSSELPVKTAWLPSGAAILLNTATSSRIMYLARDSSGDYALTPSLYYSSPGSGLFHEHMPFAYMEENGGGGLCLNFSGDPYAGSQYFPYQALVTLYDDNGDLVADREEAAPTIAPLEDPPAHFVTFGVDPSHDRVYIGGLADGLLVQLKVGTEVLGSVTGTSNPRATIMLSRSLVVDEEYYLYAPSLNTKSYSSKCYVLNRPVAAWADKREISILGDQITVTGAGFHSGLYLTCLSKSGVDVPCTYSLTSSTEMIVTIPDMTGNGEVGRSCSLLITANSDPELVGTAILILKHVP